MNTLNPKVAATSEVTSLASVTGINDWLKEKATELAKDTGGKALQWLSSEFFSAIGMGKESDIEQIKKLLDQIIVLQHQILDKLAELLTEVKFQHLITRSFESVERITSTYKRLINLADVPAAEREKETKELMQGILNTSGGIPVDLKTIHDVLVGNNPLSPGDPGVLQIFMERWLPAYRAKQLDPDVPLKTFPDKSYGYLHGVYIIQYLGISLLANARIANKQYTILGKEITELNTNLASQKTLMDKYIPAWVRNNVSFFDQRWYVIRSVQSNRNVMYGSPAAGSYLDFSVQFRDRHTNNGDEEWLFEPTGNNDIFYLRERSRPNYISKARWEVSVQPKGGSIYRMRIIMSNNFQMVLGLVQIGAIQWNVGGNNCCFIKSWDAGTEVNIEFCGH
jgi:hypothetical protein